MDSAQKISNCIRAAARELNIQEPSDEQAKSIIGLSLHEAMQILFPDHDEVSINRLVETYKHHFVTNDKTEQAMFQGVEQGLSRLTEQGALLAVATGKARRGMRRVFDQVELEHHFVVTRCADETRSKPHPQMLHEILDFTAIDPEKSIMVGDTTYDMDMARNAGIHGLGASYGVHSAESLKHANAVNVLDSFTEVIDWLLDDRVSKAYG